MFALSRTTEKISGTFRAVKCFYDRLGRHLRGGS